MTPGRALVIVTSLSVHQDVIVPMLTITMGRRPCQLGGFTSDSTKLAEHHQKAAEHHQKAAEHHRHAAEHHKQQDHEKGAHHAHLAHGHHLHATEHAENAAKTHAEGQTHS